MFVALALTKYHRDDFELWHVGVLYRDDDSSDLRLLEMMGDQDVRDRSVEDPSTGWSNQHAWIPLPLNDNEKRLLIGLCRQIGKEIGRISESLRLAFVYNGGKFSAATGLYAQADGEYGLYCSSFVLALCRGAGVELLDRGTWTSTADMTDAIDWFVRGLYSRGEDLHPRQISGDRSTVVFHPLDLAGACAADTLKVDFLTSQRHRERIRGQYDELFPPDDF